MATPKLSSPLAEIEVPKRMVDAGGLPVKDARELPVDDEKLILMQIAVHEYMGELRSRFHPLCPLLDSADGCQTIGRFSNGVLSCGRVQSTTEPAIVGAIVVSRWAGAS